MLTRKEMEIIRKMYEFLERGIDIVGPSMLAREFSMTRVSAYEFMNNLAKKKYLIHHKKKGFSLSERGRRLGERIVRNHRVLEHFMFSMLKIDLEKACEYARRLDIDIPEELIESLYDVLGRPKCCPHGKPIPRCI